MDNYIPNDIQIISDIEKENDVISIFKYKNITAWIAIKELLTTSYYDKKIRLSTGNKKDIFSLYGLRTIATSWKNYFYYIRTQKKKSLFLGASTGLFTFEDKILDSYFPYYDLDVEDSIYMLNCGNLSELLKHKKFILENHGVIENYIVAVAKKILSKGIKLVLPKSKKKEIKTFCEYLISKDIEVSFEQIISKYSEFIAGYKLYRVFFKFLKIDKAYIVSASSKSDMLTALKSLNIEVVEIQHGIVGKLHRGYNYAFSRNKQLPIPDKINVYNQFWKDEIIKAGYFDEAQINIVGRLKYDIVKDDIKELNYKYIIFTGQGAFFEEIIKFFHNSDKVLKLYNINMIYKSHPRELKEEIEDFKNSISSLKACEVVENNYTTEELIKHAYAHISVFSSCHFDAIYYKNKTYILDIMGNNIMNYYANNNPRKFLKINNIEEILNNENII